MASISGTTNEKVYSVGKWLGLNEHPDGDTRLKLGEASKMENWKVTRDGNLKRRPGMDVVAGLCASYTANISASLQWIVDFNSKNDMIEIYREISTTKKPGTISTVNYNWSVDQGEWSVADATVEDGILTAGDVEFVISNGVLRTAEDVSGEIVTIQGLIDILSELDEGEYIYVSYYESIFAINETCITESGGKYTLSGYLVTAKPSADNQPVMGMWTGYVGGKRCFLAACNDRIWSLYDPDTDTFVRDLVTVDSGIEYISTEKHVNFIPFDGDVYIQNGKEYYYYDGTLLRKVPGYVPLVATSIGPVGTADSAGVLLYPVNLLTNKRRVWLSPNGDSSKTFQLPEVAKEIVSVTSTIDGSALSYTFTANTDIITITSTLFETVDGVEVEYAVKTHNDDSNIPNYRAQVTGNNYAELFAGNQDTTLFFYGDGTNRALYSGMDYYGMPRADYFPDQYEVRIGDSNTPITGMVRHYSELICYKPNECWNLSYGQTTLADGSITIALYTVPVNRDKGNEAMGQVQLVENNPVTCSGTELYYWVNSSYYTSNLTRDERQAKRISDRIHNSLREMDFVNCKMWDDNDNQEFYIVSNGMALVWNYVADAWYKYTNFPAVSMCSFLGDMYIGTPEGKVLRLTYDKKTDDGKVVLADWVSGAIDFGADYMRKYSSSLWVGLKPEDGTSVDVCLMTDRKDTFRDKIASSTRAKVKGQPFMVKTKIKAKKFVYYRLELSVREQMPAVTVTNVDFRVRQTGYAK